MGLSIIIALYNTEAYVEKCIRSIYEGNGLSFDKFEVVVINDGSTDQSRVIVERLQEEFLNLILINKENGGQSSARNMGFDIAKGDYIFCLDSDDFVDAKALVHALEYSKRRGLDMLPISFRKFNENYELLKANNDLYPVIDEIMTGGEFMNKFTVSGSMWRYFYKTSVLKNNKLRLTEGIFHEDEEFVIKFMSHSQKIAYQGHLVYNHLIRSDSTVNKKNKEHRKILLNNLFTVVKNLNKYRDNFTKSSAEYMGISKKMEMLIISIFLRVKRDKLSYDDARSFIGGLSNINLYPINIKHNNIKFRLMAKFLNNSFLLKLFYK